MHEPLIKIIEKYETIAIFRHVYPDGDALGSQFGLKSWIQSHYPNKKVVALGKQGDDLINFPIPDAISDEELKEACAIVVDTANTDRIDDERYKLCQYLIKIDHHPLAEEYGDLSIVLERASATCEIITSLLMVYGKTCSKETATYLYCGLLTDTLQLSIPSVTKVTLNCAAFLAECGVDIAACNEAMFSSTLTKFKYDAYLKNHCQIIDGKIAYMIVDQKTYESFGLTFLQAKENVGALSKVIDFEMWALFTQNPHEEGICYNGSLRSKRIQINDIASLYHGGGHKLAAGVKQLTANDISELLDKLKNRLFENQ